MLNAGLNLATVSPTGQCVIISPELGLQIWYMSKDPRAALANSVPSMY